MGTFNIYVCLYSCMPPRTRKKPLPQSAVAIFLREDVKKGKQRLFPEGKAKVARGLRLAMVDGQKVINWHDKEIRRYLDTGDYYDENGILTNDYCDVNGTRHAPAKAGLKKKFTAPDGEEWNSRLEYYEHLSVIATKKATADKAAAEGPEEEEDEDEDRAEERSTPEKSHDFEDEDDDAEAEGKAEEDAKARKVLEDSAAKARKEAQDADAKKKAVEADAKKKAVEADAKKKAAEADAKKKAAEADARGKAVEAAKARKVAQDAADAREKAAAAAKTTAGRDVEDDDEGEPEYELEGPEEITGVDTVSTSAELDRVASGKPDTVLMSQRTGRVCCASLLRCFMSGSAYDSANPALLAAWAKDDAAAPSLTSPFWRNFSTIVFYDTASRVIACTLYPTTFNNTPPSDTQDGHAIFYQETSAMMIHTQPKKFIRTLTFTESSLKVGAWTLHQSELGFLKPRTNTLASSGQAAFTHPTECTFQHLTCRDSQDVASFLLAGEHGASPKPRAFGWYLAQVEDIADDVYYHTDPKTQEQYKCFHCRNKWRIVRFDNIGLYEELYTSEDTLQPKAARHPRHVKIWTAQDTNIKIRIDLAATHYRGARRSLARSQRLYETSVLPYKCDKSKKFSLVCYGANEWYMQKFHNDTTTYLKQGDAVTTKGIYQTNEPEWPQVLRSTTLFLIECLQDVVVFDLTTKRITTTLSWSEAISAFRAGESLTAPQLSFTDQNHWSMVNKAAKPYHILQTMHRQLPVVGKGFFLCAAGTDQPTHYCTHARNVRGFTLETRTFNPTHATQAGQTFEASGGASTTKSLKTLGTYQWNVKLNSITLLTSKPFAETALAFMHPIYADFEKNAAKPDKEDDEEARRIDKEKLRLDKRELELRKAEESLGKKESKPGTEKYRHIRKERADHEIEKKAHDMRVLKRLEFLEHKVEQYVKVIDSEGPLIRHVRVQYTEATKRLHLEYTQHLQDASRRTAAAADATRIDVEMRQRQLDEKDQRMHASLLRAGETIAAARDRLLLFQQNLAQSEALAQTAADRIVTFQQTLAGIEQTLTDRLVTFNQTLAVNEQNATDCLARVAALELDLTARVTESTLLQQQVVEAAALATQSRDRAVTAEAEATRAQAAATTAAAALTEVQRQTNEEYLALTAVTADLRTQTAAALVVAAGHEARLRAVQAAVDAARDATVAAQTEAEAARTATQDAQRDVAMAQRDIDAARTTTQTAAAAVQEDIAAARTDAQTAATQAQAFQREAEAARTAAQDAKRDVAMAQRDIEAAKSNAKRAGEQAGSQANALRQVVQRAELAQAAAEEAHAKELIAMRQREAARQGAATDDASSGISIRLLDESVARAAQQTAILQAAAADARMELQQLQASRQSTPEPRERAAAVAGTSDNGRLIAALRKSEDLNRDLSRKLQEMAQIPQGSIAVDNMHLQELARAVQDNTGRQAQMQLEIDRLQGQQRVADRERTFRGSPPRRDSLRPGSRPGRGPVSDDIRLPEVLDDAPLHTLAVSTSQTSTLLSDRTAEVYREIDQFLDLDELSAELSLFVTAINEDLTHLSAEMQKITEPSAEMTRYVNAVIEEANRATEGVPNALLYIQSVIAQRIQAREDHARELRRDALQAAADTTGALQLVMVSAVEDTVGTALLARQASSMARLKEFSRQIEIPVIDQNALNILTREIVLDNELTVDMMNEYLTMFKDYLGGKDSMYTDALSPTIFRMTALALSNALNTSGDRDNLLFNSRKEALQELMNALKEVVALHHKVRTNTRPAGGALRKKNSKNEDLQAGSRDIEETTPSNPRFQPYPRDHAPLTPSHQNSAARRVESDDPEIQLLTPSHQQAIQLNTECIDAAAFLLVKGVDLDPALDPLFLDPLLQQAKVAIEYANKTTPRHKAMIKISRAYKQQIKNWVTPMPEGAIECRFVLLRELDMEIEKIREQIADNILALSEIERDAIERDHTETIQLMAKYRGDPTPPEVPQKSIAIDFFGTRTPVWDHMQHLIRTKWAELDESAYNTHKDEWTAELNEIAAQTDDKVQRKAQLQAISIAVRLEIDKMNGDLEEIQIKRTKHPIPEKADECYKRIMLTLEALNSNTESKLKKSTASQDEKELGSWELAAVKYPSSEIAAAFNNILYGNSDNEQKRERYNDRMKPTTSITETVARTYGIRHIRDFFGMFKDIRHDPIEHTSVQSPAYTEYAQTKIQETYGDVLQHHHSLTTLNWERDGKKWTQDYEQLPADGEQLPADEHEDDTGDTSSVASILHRNVTQARFTIEAFENSISDLPKPSQLIPSNLLKREENNKVKACYDIVHQQLVDQIEILETQIKRDMTLQLKERTYSTEETEDMEHIAQSNLNQFCEHSVMCKHYALLKKLQPATVRNMQRWLLEFTKLVNGPSKRPETSGRGPPIPRSRSRSPSRRAAGRVTESSPERRERIAALESLETLELNIVIARHKYEAEKQNVKLWNDQTASNKSLWKNMTPIEKKTFTTELNKLKEKENVARKHLDALNKRKTGMDRRAVRGVGPAARRERDPPESGPDNPGIGSEWDYL
jgi:hypothetical protein